MIRRAIKELVEYAVQRRRQLEFMERMNAALTENDRMLIAREAIDHMYEYLTRFISSHSLSLLSDYMRRRAATDEQRTRDVFKETFNFNFGGGDG
jgi:hypothetical protein